MFLVEGEDLIPEFPSLSVGIDVDDPRGVQFQREEVELIP
jgi:hypothetical protein